MAVLRFLRNIFGHTITGNAGNAILPNYQLYGEVRVEMIPNSGTFFKTQGYLMDPGAGIASFFAIGSAFRGYFIAPKFNPWPINTISKVTYNKLNGKLYGGEFYGEIPEVEGSLTLIENYVVLKAGTQEGIGFSAALADLTTNKRFLTHHPEVKVVSPTQPELLHFLNIYADVTAITLKATICYTDLSEMTINAKTISGLDQWDLLRIPAGLTSLNLAAVFPSKTISHYELWLEDQDNEEISERKIYELDQYTYETERFWMFENSFGMPEIFRTVGRASYKNAIGTSVSKRMVTYDQDTKVPSFQINRTANRSTADVSTGYLRDKETAIYMLDFLTQKGTLYELRSADYFPYQLQAPSMHEVATDDDFSYYVRFQVLGAFENQ
jgi:hypothetical protein